jgi:hypothetical protein
VMTPASMGRARRCGAHSIGEFHHDVFDDGCGRWLRWTSTVTFTVLCEGLGRGLSLHIG